MSRTYHHKEQRKNKGGLDFGARYECDKHYSTQANKESKDIARSERRNLSKRVIRRELDDY